MEKLFSNVDERLMEQEEERVEDDESECPVPPANIYSYNETRSCFDIVRMLQDNDLCRTPDFQRSDVWEMPQKTRFIDSLLKKLPIPSMCFSVDSNDSYLVIDGKQRTGTILEFLGKDVKPTFKLSILDDVDPRISGKTLEEIKEYIRSEEEAEREIGMVIFDDELSAKQIRNIEAELKIKILQW